MTIEISGVGKPYFVSYQMWDLRRAHSYASFGAIVSRNDFRQRTLDIDLRVGDYAFDNSDVVDRALSHRSITLPLDDEYDAVRRELWLATDRVFKHAAEALERKHAVVGAETKSADDVDSFSKEPPAHLTDLHEAPALNPAKLDALAKTLSAVFRLDPDIYRGDVSISATSGRHYFVSSEGSESEQPKSFVRTEIECSTQAADGMPLHDTLEFFTKTTDELPAERELVAKVKALSAELSALRAAPVVGDYSGPVLFEGVAAGQLVRTLLAENLSGTPGERSDHPGQRRGTESQLVGKVGQRIFPRGVEIVDDPTATRIADQVLVGGAGFDEEGIAAQKVSLVEDGVFKRFLMSRIPRKGFAHSNGHAASSPVSRVAAHPMNLIVQSTKAVSDAELRRRAFAAAKEEGLTFILVVEKLDLRSFDDDFDSSRMVRPGSIESPTVVKRVYLDGREEYVRGAAFGSINLHDLREMIALGAKPVVYSYFGEGTSWFSSIFENGSGYLISIAAPSLLLRAVDVSKPVGAQRLPPIVPRPS